MAHCGLSLIPLDRTRGLWSAWSVGCTQHGRSARGPGLCAIRSVKRDERSSRRSSSERLEVVTTKRLNHWKSSLPKPTLRRHLVSTTVSLLARWSHSRRYHVAGDTFTARWPRDQRRRCRPARWDHPAAGWPAAPRARPGPWACPPKGAGRGPGQSRGPVDHRPTSRRR